MTAYCNEIDNNDTSLASDLDEGSAAKAWTNQCHFGDCLETMRKMPDNCVDSIVTDPPYELGFMGKSWDSTGIANNVEMWREAMRVLKPGGHLLAFSGSRTYHRMTCAIEDAGFEVRDQIMWVYGSGFPKSLDVSKAIDKAAGAERAVIGQRVRLGDTKAYAHNETGGNCYGEPNGAEHRPPLTAPATDAAQQWQGWGTALKPAHEPICVARKPLAKGNTVAANVLRWGTGALNIDACRVGGEARPLVTSDRRLENNTYAPGLGGSKCEGETSLGRWPANLIHDGSDEVLAGFPANAGASAPVRGMEASRASVGNVTGERNRVPGAFHADSGSAARFFYCAKASKNDRGANNTHPTVKPTDLMRYLCRLVTPPGGVVLDPFMGSGSTCCAALLERFHFVGIERDAGYIEIARARIASTKAQGIQPSFEFWEAV